MRPRTVLPLAGLLMFSGLATAHAEGRWCVSLGVGQSVSEHHGSAIEAAAYAQVHPLLGLGLETGMAYMQLPAEPELVFPADAGGGASARLESLTDGLTRNRGLYLGPALRVGQQLYAVASAGLYELSDNDGHWLDTRWGGSAGIGLSGTGRFSPRGELRYRWAPDRKGVDLSPLFGRPMLDQRFKQDASAIVFTIGVDFR